MQMQWFPGEGKQLSGIRGHRAGGGTWCSSAQRYRSSWEAEGRKAGGNLGASHIILGLDRS